MPPVDPGNALAVANRVMYELLGRRLVWPPNDVVEEYETNQRNIHLLGRPIRVINSVTINGDEILDYEVMNASVLILPRECHNWLWSTTGYIWTGIGPVDFDPYDPACGRKIVVDYQYGSDNPPPQVQNAIDILAFEIEAFYSDSECRLPSRVKEISSRGIDMTLIDPMEWLEDGLTGIPEVDFAIRVFNPSKAKKRARVYSADHRPGRRHQRTGS